MEEDWENNANTNEIGNEEQICVRNTKKKRKNTKINDKSIKSSDNIEDLQDKINLNSNCHDKKDKSTRKLRKNTLKRTRTSSANNKAEGLETAISKKDNKKIGDSENYLGSLLVNRIDCDTQTNVDDDKNVYMSLPSAPEGETPDESPESKRKRLEMVSKQCRLHPSNEKYNQGPVLDPPPITPGIVVGYTPAGQRYEVDLNSGRPTWFNSEYAQRQYDDATKINVSRMMNDLSKGYFLPDTLNPDVEKQYFKEKALITEEATKYFESMKISEQNSDRERQGKDIHCTSDDKEHHPKLVNEMDKLQLLETERQLIEVTEFAVVKMKDFPNETSKKICQLLKVKLTPLMFLKNPIIVETIEKLSKQRTYIGVNRSARALNDLIKLLFHVPDSQTFQEHFISEVKKLEEKTKNMTKFDLAILTEESEISNGVCYSACTSSSNLRTEKQTSGIGTEDETKVQQAISLKELDEEWVPVEEGDNWKDVMNDNITYSSDDGAQNMNYEERNVASMEAVSESERDAEMSDSHVSQHTNDSNSVSDRTEVINMNTGNSEE